MAVVRLSCRRCGASCLVDMDVTYKDGEAVIDEGTLNNNWALRWLRSHAEPVGEVVRP